MVIKKRIVPLRVAMYIGKDNMQVYEDLKEVAKSTGLSMSDVVYFSFVTGFYSMRDGFLKLNKHSQVRMKKNAK
jgi:hypothetical protein